MSPTSQFRSLQNISMVWGADALLPLQPGDLGRTDVAGPDQGVLGDAFFLHYVPQVVTGDHHTHASLSARMLTEIDV